MSNNKPLCYEGSKTVLKYLEANLRFQLSSLCSSLRKTEQLVPLYIDQLMFRKDKFLKMSVNSDEYYVGVYRKYPPGVKIPTEHQKDNDNGGYHYDIDKFGFVVYSEIILPGDVVFVEPPIRHWWEEEEEEGEFIDHLLPHVPRVHVPPTDDEQIEELEKRLNNYQYVSDEHRQNDIDRLQKFKNRRDNVEVPYERLAQLTIKRSDGSKKIHRFRGRIYEAQKSLYNLMFGNRKHAITVGKIKLHLSSGVLRFPLGMKLKVTELACHVHQIEEIHKVIDSSSFPLGSLEVYKQRFDRRSAELECFQKARKLIVSGVTDIRPLISVKNQRIHVIFLFMPTEEYINLVEHWKNTPRPVGICFTFGQCAEFPYPDIAEVIERECNGTRVGERLIEIPVNEDSKIQVSHESVEWGKVELILKFEVVTV